MLEGWKAEITKIDDFSFLTIGHICARTLRYCAQNRSSLILKTDIAKSDKKVKAFQLFFRQALNDYIFS